MISQCWMQGFLHPNLQGQNRQLFFFHMQNMLWSNARSTPVRRRCCFSHNNSSFVIFLLWVAKIKIYSFLSNFYFMPVSVWSLHLDLKGWLKMIYGWAKRTCPTNFAETPLCCLNNLLKMCCDRSIRRAEKQSSCTKGTIQSFDRMRRRRMGWIWLARDEITMRTIDTLKQQLINPMWW